MAYIKLNWKSFEWKSDHKWKNDILPKLESIDIKENELDRSIYVLRLQKLFLIEYPKGLSPVIYIGEGNFKSRIESHSKIWLQNLDEIIQDFGLKIYISTPRVKNNTTAYKDVEAILIEEFSNIYGTAPLNNKQYENNKINHNFDITDIKEPLKIGKGFRYKWSIKPLKTNLFYDSYNKTHL
jgi:hypothetical protein